MTSNSFVISAVVARIPTFWLGLIGALAALHVLPTVIGVVWRLENPYVVLILNLFLIAWPAALVVTRMVPRKEDLAGLPVVPVPRARLPRRVRGEGGAL